MTYSDVSRCHPPKKKAEGSDQANNILLFVYNWHRFESAHSWSLLNVSGTSRMKRWSSYHFNMDENQSQEETRPFRISKKDSVPLIVCGTVNSLYVHRSLTGEIFTQLTSEPLFHFRIHGLFPDIFSRSVLKTKQYFLNCSESRNAEWTRMQKITLFKQSK